MSLITKYNVAAPRYTSYPTVPYWEESSFDADKWKALLKKSFQESNHRDGISIYIHLPFCESLCTYCGCNKYITVNHAVEGPYIEALLKEWQLYVSTFGSKPRIREIHLGGGTPTFFSAGHLTTLLNGIYSQAELLPDACLSFEGHPGNTTPEHLQSLYNLGFRRISLGIQDFDMRVQEIINRLQPFGMVASVVENARKIGFTSINFDLIYGLPLQTLTSMQHTIDKVVRLRPDRISFYSYAHVPWIKGTGQRRYTEDDLPKDEEKRQLYELGKLLFDSNGYTEIGMDHFALPGEALHKAFEQGNLHRNFMGYTVSHTSLLIGLGASSIGDNWYAYVQNEKQVNAYEELVNKGEFPIVRGHILSDEDLLLRKHIHNLMCHFETTWRREDTQCDAVIDGLQRLQELERDELVLVTPQKVQVTAKGKPFIRNICMAFDARLWRQVPHSQLFSKAI
ncbi:oxygen-independent coproporphyrinogen III oxidase [Chitinophaga polysaccharea]|uniref:oxygen-independent coproporphyrinogen III oxidase n=1 Tax=Chitinophaga TaxID=79328 RepID=UPI0014559F29|nr:MULTISPECIES: oxygen-independent coproporphyrinogen III oxidase [Chitinophaga]NLR59779.1 oxygen-independent coproporphyrinogen III oxidase [Chitinophaga polysaccharea]NLU94132.1 oxygen-independent coproporphyrinogen III oxidase [Chitinophaga sp. Ak27]